MISKSFHYLILVPISLLPFRVLYILSDLLYFILYKIIGYRKQVIETNINNSFPDLDASKRKKIASNFYKHLCDIMVEGIKSFSISKNQLVKKFSIKNPELIDQYAKKNQSVIVVGGHYNNWEMFAQATPLYHKHKCLGIYKPLSNEFYNNKMLSSRQKFGFTMFSMKETIRCFKDPSTKAIFFASDQSPSNFKNVYWTTFLNQKTPVQFGVERLSKLYNYPIFSYHITKTKRGCFEAEYELLCENPTATKKGEITELFTKKIESSILKKPEFWLWSHKRWKTNKYINN